MFHAETSGYVSDRAYAILYAPIRGPWVGQGLGWCAHRVTRICVSGGQVTTTDDAWMAASGVTLCLPPWRGKLGTASPPGESEGADAPPSRQ